MSTRGITGVKSEGKYFISYNHSDSYPSSLGCEMIEFVKDNINNIDAFKEKFKNVISVKNSEAVPLEFQKKYGKYADTGVSSGQLSEWYVLLRNLQGIDWLEEILNGNLCHYIDSYDFVKDSLFCEWGYIIDLNNNVLNIYCGLQEEPFEENEFGIENNRGYYPIKLIKQINFNDIKNLSTDDCHILILNVEKIEEEEENV